MACQEYILHAVQLGGDVGRPEVPALAQLHVLVSLLAKWVKQTNDEKIPGKLCAIVSIKQTKSSYTSVSKKQTNTCLLGNLVKKKKKKKRSPPPSLSHPPPPPSSKSGPLVTFYLLNFFFNECFDIRKKLKPISNTLD